MVHVCNQIATFVVYIDNSNIIEGEVISSVAFGVWEGPPLAPLLGIDKLEGWAENASTAYQRRLVVCSCAKGFDLKIGGSTIPAHLVLVYSKSFQHCGALA